MKQLFDKYLKQKGWTRNPKKDHQSGAAAIAPFAPFFLADCLYLTYEEHIKGRLRQKEKHHASRMMECYHRFIHDFFNAFDSDEHDKVIETMDNFGDYIHNDIEMLRIQIQNVVMEMPVEQRTIFSAIGVCRVLSANIKSAWNAIYRRSKAEPIPNSDVSGIFHHGKELFCEYSRYAPRQLDATDLGDYTGVKQSEINLIKRITKFIDTYYENN